MTEWSRTPELYLPLAKRLLAAEGKSTKTLTRRAVDFRLFVAFLNDNGPTDLRDVNRDAILSFLEWLKTRVSEKTHRTYSHESIKSAVASVKELFRVLYAEGLLLTNPAREIRLKTPPKSEERAILSEGEMVTFLESFDVTTKEGFKSRVLFELLYATGLRSGEVVNLTWSDVDLEDRTLLVRAGKGNKDRMVALSKLAVRFLTLYGERTGRKGLVFPGPHGKLTVSAVNNRFIRAATSCGVMRGRLTVHSIRHSVATHLLHRGADLRYVQELLGHESVETTLIYARETEEHLRRILKQYHPRENGLYREADAQYLVRVATLRQALTSREPARRNYRENKARYEANRTSPRRR